MNFKLKTLRFVYFTALAMCISISISANEPKGTNIYNPAGKRDPFKVLVLGSAQRKPTAIYPTEKYDLEQLTLKAILRVQGKSRAMVQAPDGQTFVIVEGEVVGRERATLSRILKTEIIFTQKTFNYLGNSSLIERVLSLPPEQVRDRKSTRLNSSHVKRSRMPSSA